MKPTIRQSSNTEKTDYRPLLQEEVDIIVDRVKSEIVAKNTKPKGM